MQRRTRQREAIWAVIRNTGRPLGPEEILEGARRVVDGLGIATVYRAIKDWTGEGKLVPVEISGQPPKVEIAGLKHHHHFCCEACGRVFELEGCGLHFNASLPTGFAVKRHEVTLYGRCGDCTA